MQFYRQWFERVKTLPRVDSAGGNIHQPLSGALGFVHFCPEDTVCQGVGKDPLTALRHVIGGCFETVGTLLLQGRAFNERSAASSPPVAIVIRRWPSAPGLARIP
jgi:hypothetical protein